MPLPLPVTGIMIFVLTGLVGVAVFSGYKLAEDLGPELDPEDLLPALPPNPPVPRFLIEKTDIMKKFKRR